MSTLPPSTGPMAGPDAEEFREQLVRHWLLASLDEGSRQALLERFEIKTLPAFQVLFSEGDPSTGLYVVLAGRVQVTTGAGPTRRKLGVSGTGELIGDSAALTGEPRRARVHATRDTALAFLPIAALEEAAAATPGLWRTIGAFVVRRAAGRNVSMKMRQQVVEVL